MTVLMPNVTLFGIAPQALYLFLIMTAVVIASIPLLHAFLYFSKLNRFFLMFVIVSFVSLVWADDLGMALRMLAKLIAPLLFFLSAMVFFESDADLEVAERAIFCCCFAVLALALVNNLSGGSLGDARGTSKWVARNYLTAPFMSPANFSFLIGCGATLAFGNFLYSKRFRYLFMTAVFSAAVAWAFTRIAMAGLIAAFAVCLFFQTKSIIVKVLLPGGIVCAFLVLFISVDSFRDRMFHDAEWSTVNEAISSPNEMLDQLNTSGRGALWSMAADRFSDDNALVGAGLGAVDSWLAQDFDSLRLHSEFLRVRYDLGFLGLVLYGLAILYFFFLLIRIRSPSNKFVPISLAVLTFYTITLATDNTLNYVTEFGLYVYVLMAMAFVRNRLELTEQQNETRSSLNLDPIEAR